MKKRRIKCLNIKKMGILLKGEYKEINKKTKERERERNDGIMTPETQRNG